jgi:hypothetical protein
MATAIMTIPPADGEAFEKDLDYRISAEEEMEKLLDSGQADEVILAYATEGAGDPTAGNPGIEEFLGKLGASKEIVEYVLSFEDNKDRGKLANEFRKDPSITLEQLKETGEKLRKVDELTEEEVSMFRVIRGVQPLRKWLKREMRLLKEELGIEEFRKQAEERGLDEASMIEILDWWQGTGEPDMSELSFDSARIDAITWATEESDDLDDARRVYRRTKPENILYADPETGYTVQNIDNENDLIVEGREMKHCVAGYWGKIEDGGTQIISLRDPRNRPHATIELVRAMRWQSHLPGRESGMVGMGRRPHGPWKVRQIKGVANSVPKQKYREILKRYFESIEPITWEGSRSQGATQRRGQERLRDMAIDDVVGQRWQRTPYSRDSETRPNDLTNEEVAAMIDVHTKNVMAAVKHKKRYPGTRKARSRDPVRRYAVPVVNLYIKKSVTDEYGITQYLNERIERPLGASSFVGDVRIFMGDLFSVKLTPELKGALDRFSDLIPEIELLEDKYWQEWHRHLTGYIRETQAYIQKCRKLITKAETESKVMALENSIAIAEEKEANALDLLENERSGAIAPGIARMAADRVGMVRLSPLAQKYNAGRGDVVQECAPAWSRENAWLYLMKEIFRKITGQPLFKKGREP